MLNKIIDGIKTVGAAIEFHGYCMEAPVGTELRQVFLESLQGSFWFYLNGGRQLQNGALVWFDEDPDAPESMTDSNNINWDEWELVDADYDDTSCTEYFRHRETGMMMCQESQVYDVFAQ